MYLLPYVVRDEFFHAALGVMFEDGVGVYVPTVFPSFCGVRAAKLFAYDLRVLVGACPDCLFDG